MIYRINESYNPEDRIYYTDIDHNDDDDIIDLEDIFESVDLIGDIKKTYDNISELKSQWKKVADKFVKHLWIYRYIDEKQKDQLQKHYANITDEKCPYSTYKKSFNFICKFMGLPADKVIIENIVFDKNKRDKEMYEMSIRYSKGLAKVKIPEGIELIHVSPVENITELVPTFRSKVKGKYMYPNKRVFFTIARQIKKKHAGLENDNKLFRYTPRDNIQYAYIDPTYSDFGSGSVYIETNVPIPVVTLEKKLFGIFKMKKQEV